jgi:hypothetical protein
MEMEGVMPFVYVFYTFGDLLPPSGPGENTE